MLEGLGPSEIAELLPHRPPMLLVDRVLSVVPGKTLSAIKCVTTSEPCYGSIDACRARTWAYPPTLILESLCQSAGLLFLLGESGTKDWESRLLIFGAVRGFRLSRVVVPGDTMVHTAYLDKKVEGSAVFSGHTEVNGNRVATLEAAVAAIRGALPERRDGGSNL